MLYAQSNLAQASHRGMTQTEFGLQVQRHGCIEALAEKTDERLGLIVSTAPITLTYIEDVQAGSWAEACGMMPGDILTALNGEDTSTMTDFAFQSMFRARPLQVSTRRASSSERRAAGAASRTVVPLSRTSSCPSTPRCELDARSRSPSAQRQQAQHKPVGWNTPLPVDDPQETTAFSGSNIANSCSSQESMDRATVSRLLHSGAALMKAAEGWKEDARLANAALQSAQHQRDAACREAAELELACDRLAQAHDTNSMANSFQRDAEAIGRHSS
eukprot:2576026-Amphidinium_carterae.1